MKRFDRHIALVIALTAALSVTLAAAAMAAGIPLPAPGQYLHGVFPGGPVAYNNDITAGAVDSYEAAAGKQAAWVYFSHNWVKGRAFPLARATWIRSRGSIPFIRLQLFDRNDRNAPLSRVLKGTYDRDLKIWARAARNFGTPLLVEFGTEVNGWWYSTNAKWNGAGTTTGYGDPTKADGPERFRAAYRRIVKICRTEGASNITWVFHVNHHDWPEEPWNRMEEYYPGDQWVDWIGVSLYGSQKPTDTWWSTFSPLMDIAYPRLARISPAKPLVVLEFGAASGNPLGDQAVWAEEALNDLTAGRWPKFIGFSWWNETWRSDSDPSHDSHMRLQDNSALADVFRRRVGENPAALGRIPATP
jgi:hypothetical protein